LADAGAGRLPVTRGRADAAAAVDETCPRCGARRAPEQEFCVECGFQLPDVKGRVPSLRRRWIARFGWYPGDWVWVSLLTLVVAVAGAAVAIAATADDGSGNGSTVVAQRPTTAPPPVPQTTTRQTVTRAGKTTTRTVTTPAPPPPNGRTAWPAGRDGWTNVLGSYPLSDGRGPAEAAARRAANRGLPEVGVLVSSAYSSLHPGYYVVFSGVYTTPAEADAALATAHAGGFAGAYSRQIAQ
jgi:hypothetical protein